MDNYSYKKDLWLHANYYYHSMGFNVSCISDEENKYNKFDKNISKTPNHPWIYLIKNRQDEDIFQSLDWKNAKGIGTVLGYKKLRALDIDGSTDVNFIKETLETLGLPPNYEWVVRSGSLNGFHIIFYSGQHIFYEISPNVSFLSNSANKKSFEKLELRWIGNLVLPPSNLSKYQFINSDIPKSIPQEVASMRIGLLVRSNCIINFKETYSSEGFLDYKLENNLSVNNSPQLAAPIDTDLIGDITSENNNFKGYVVIDTETNGLPVDFNSSYTNGTWPRLLQLAYAIFDFDGTLLLKKDFYITPSDFEVKQEVFELTNLQHDKLVNYGIPLQLALKQFVFDTQNVEFVIGHNITFDLNVILGELYRHNISFPSNKKFVCTMKGCKNLKQVDQILDGKYPKLKELYRILFNTELSNSHNAMSDVLATNECYREMDRLIRAQISD